MRILWSDRHFGFRLAATVAGLVVLVCAASTSPADSHAAALFLSPVMTVRQPTPTLVGDSVEVTVRPGGAVAGVLLLEQQKSGRWVILRQVPVANRRTISFSLREAKPGTFIYRAVVRAPSSRSVITATTKIRVVASGVRAVPRAGTIVIPSSAVVETSRNPTGTQTARLAVGIAAPHAGQALAVPASSSSDGVLGIVSSVTANGDGTHSVVTRPATLDEAYSDFHAALSGELGTLATVSRSQRRASGVSPGSASAFPLTCEADGLSVKPIIDLSTMKVDFQLTTVPPTIHLVVQGTPTVGLDISSARGISCKLDDKIALRMVVPGTPIVVTIAPHFELSASGAISLKITWSPGVTFGFDRGPNNSLNIYTIHPTSPSITASLGAHAEAYFGGSVGISVAGTAGVTGTFGPDITGDVTLPPTTPTPCVKLDAALKAVLSVYAHVFFKDFTFTLASGTFDQRKLYENCSTSGGTGGGSGGSPPTAPNPSSNLEISFLGTIPSQLVEATRARPEDGAAAKAFFDYICATPGTVVDSINLGEVPKLPFAVEDREWAVAGWSQVGGPFNGLLFATPSLYGGTWTPGLRVFAFDTASGSCSNTRVIGGVEFQKVFIAFHVNGDPLDPIGTPLEADVLLIRFAGGLIGPTLRVIPVTGTLSDRYSTP